jgi:nicotinamide mononucleotide transporter
VFYNAKLYGDMGLQVFIVVSVRGWYSWRRGGAAHGALQVTRLDRAGRRTSLAGWRSAFALLAYFLKTWTDTDVPHVDGFPTAGSLAGGHQWRFEAADLVGTNSARNAKSAAMRIQQAF